MGMNLVNCDKTKRIIKEYNYCDKFSIGNCNPPIKEIINISMKLTNVKRELICTCTGFKLCIKGIKVVRISYETCGCSGKVVSCKFASPFFELIPLNLCTNILDICSKVCYCSGDVMSERCIYVYNIISINILIDAKEEPHCEDHCKNNCDCDNSSIKYDCDINDCDICYSPNPCEYKCQTEKKFDNKCFEEVLSNFDEKNWSFKNDFLSE
ncbi:MAG: hypothetical protein E6929_15265 [Clostridium sp.]|nr:hypothetical protein [Clostridium sp.]